MFLTGLVAVSLVLPAAAETADAERPNVLVIITDDQGYGDAGFHGNAVIRTPHLDKLAAESVELTRFYVSPVCAPTRASLMTGRYNYRTGAVDTYIGRAMMHPDEVTLAEMLTGKGYRTGIFGKWHLGDNYPLRPMDQGFQESLVHKGGGIGQPSDLPGGSSYFDPVLLHNGKVAQAEGYCSDVFTDAAMAFIEHQRDKPFFAYLAFNAPHDPLEVPDEYERVYRQMQLAREQFPETGQPLPEKINWAAVAKVYGMVTNIDDNLGRLLAKIDELDLSRRTIVVFLTDNGPAQARFNGGLRGTKGTVYEGGVRVPCLVRWPGRLEAGRKVDEPAAHIDLVPTLLEACGLGAPEASRLDGRSAWKLLTGEQSEWPERTLFFQWHRGDEPELFRAFAARGPRWKLVQAAGVPPGGFAPKFELFDLLADPYETTDLAAEKPEIAEQLRGEYEAWFRDVGATRGYEPPRIHLGSRHENPTLLTRQDWRGPRAGWAPGSLGHWEVEVVEAGDYRVKLEFAPATGAAHLAVGGQDLEQPLADRESQSEWDSVRLERGPTRLEAWIAVDGETIGVQYVEVERK
ncbi:MAG: arylsulfatase [Pirellulales bacterium]